MKLPDITQITQEQYDAITAEIVQAIIKQLYPRPQQLVIISIKKGEGIRGEFDGKEGTFEFLITKSKIEYGLKDAQN